MKKLNNQGFSHDILALMFVVIFGIAGVAYMVASYADTKTPGVYSDPSLHVVVKDACEWLPSGSGFKLEKITEDVLWPKMPKYTKEAYDLQISPDGNWSGNSTLTVRTTGNPGYPYPGYPGYLYQNIPDGDVGANGIVLHLSQGGVYHVRVLYTYINVATSGTDTFSPHCVPPPAPHLKNPSPAPTGKPSSSSASSNSTPVKAAGSSKSPGNTASGQAQSGATTSTATEHKQAIRPPKPHKNIFQKIKDLLSSIF